MASVIENINLFSTLYVILMLSLIVLYFCIYLSLSCIDFLLHMASRLSAIELMQLNSSKLMVFESKTGLLDLHTFLLEHQFQEDISHWILVK